MDKTTIEILQLIKKRKSLSIKEISLLLNFDTYSIESTVNWLYSKKYIFKRYNQLEEDIEENFFTANTRFSITKSGEIALYKEIHSKKAFLFNEIRAWITLAISIISLLLGIYNLLM